MEESLKDTSIPPDLQAQYEADKNKVKKMKIALAKKTRDNAGLIRKLDDIPTRAELAQYQKRFLELYQQGNIKTKYILTVCRQ